MYYRHLLAVLSVLLHPSSPEFPGPPRSGRQHHGTALYSRSRLSIGRAPPAQEGLSFHGYYGDWCFLLLYVFCGEQLLVSYLRLSNIDPAKHAWAILKLLAGRLRQASPAVKLVFRADSGFCRWKMLRWCERHGVDYIVGLAKSTRLLLLAKSLMMAAGAC